MSRPNQPEAPRAAPIFRHPHTPAVLNAIPSSSPAFATPAHPIRSYVAPAAKPSILPVLLPPASLRPLAFRTFTKKHSLTLTSSALQVLATFVGRHCGSEWREGGLAEPVLEELARSWKRLGGGVIVDGEAPQLKELLKNLEGSMSGGRIIQGRELSRQNSLVLGGLSDKLGATTTEGLRSDTLAGADSQSSLGMSVLDVDDESEDIKDARKWLKVIDAYSQPRLVYNAGKKHFDRFVTGNILSVMIYRWLISEYRDTSKPSLLPSPSHKTHVFRNRYNLIHQRLLRNESFQTPSFDAPDKPTLRRTSSALATIQQSYKLTPIANLLGRSGSNHILLGLLTVAPAGTLAINDLTGSIALDLTHAKTVPENGAWFVPGMIVLVDGIYEEEADSSNGLGSGGGIGGAIGGRFLGLTVGGPPCERRHVTLGVTGPDEKDITAGGAFGWVDFLGVGAERAVGSKMRKIEQRVIGRPSPISGSSGRHRMVIVGEVNLDQPKTFQALKKLFNQYAAEPEEDSPMTFVLMGSFVQHAVMARGGSGGSIEYKEYFDALASTLSDFPTLLQNATFIFVPGDNDGWASAFSSGAATVIPRRPVPEMFTTRIKRAFATANAEAEKERGKRADGEAIWTTNPSRLSLFGPAHEIVLFRDDITGRFRRSAIRFTATKPADGEDVDIDMAEPAPTPSEPPTDPRPAAQEINMEIDSTVPEAESCVPTQPPTESPLPPDLQAARKLVKTVLDQGYLSPFRIATRPILWDFAGALHLYPLPAAMVLADTEAPAFCVTYEGCHVMNPGSLVAPGRRGVAKWVEYDIRNKVGKVMEALF